MTKFDVVEYWQREITNVVRLARADGVILTVEQVPTTPLRMGGHKTVVSARPARMLDDSPIDRTQE